jgi:Spy/CpxP family protein refolding chaperone
MGIRGITNRSTGETIMQKANKLAAGGLLAALGLAAAVGPVALADADPPAGPQQHGWGPSDGPGERDGGWHRGGERRGGWHHHWGPGAEFHELGLTDAQHAQMKSILETARPATQELTQKIRANAKQLREITPDDKNYAQVVARVSQENGVLSGKLLAQRAKTYADLYALLAPVQKTHLAEIRARRAKWMDEHQDGRGHEGRDGGHREHRGPSADAGGAPAGDPPQA